MRLEEVEQIKLINTFLTTITSGYHANNLIWIPDVLVLLAESLFTGGVVRGFKTKPYLAYEDKNIAMALMDAALVLVPQTEIKLLQKIIFKRYHMMISPVIEILAKLNNEKYDVGNEPITKLFFLSRASNAIPKEEYPDAHKIISRLQEELRQQFSKTKKTLGVTKEQQIEKFKQVLTDCFSNRDPISANDTESATDIREFLGMMLLSLADILTSAGLRGYDPLIEKINNQAFDFLDFLEDDDNLFMLINSEFNTKKNVFPEDNPSPNEEENNISSENSSVVSQPPRGSALKKADSPKNQTPKILGWIEDENKDVKKETLDYKRDIKEYNFMHSEEPKLPEMDKVDPIDLGSKTTYRLGKKLVDMWVNRKKSNPRLASNVNYRVSYWRLDLQKTSRTKTKERIVTRCRVDKKTGLPTKEPIADVRYIKIAMRRNR